MVTFYQFLENVNTFQSIQIRSNIVFRVDKQTFVLKMLIISGLDRVGREKRVPIQIKSDHDYAEQTNINQIVCSLFQNGSFRDRYDESGAFAIRFAPRYS